MEKRVQCGPRVVVDPVHVLMHIEQEPREPIVARRERWSWRDVSGSQRRTPMTNDNRKSDSCIVPKKPANKPAPEVGAESVEEGGWSRRMSLETTSPGHRAGAKTCPCSSAYGWQRRDNG